MASLVRHRARITKVYGSTVTVMLLQDGSSCKGCRLSAMCGNRSANEFEIAKPERFPGTAGDEIEVTASAGATGLASAYLLAAPLAALLAGTLLALWAKTTDTLAAAIGLAAMTAVFIILYLARMHISKRHTIWEITEYRIPCQS